MSSSYTGDGTGITISTDGITITEPDDGDDLVAASVKTPEEKLADFVDALRDKLLAAPTRIQPGGGGGSDPPILDSRYLLGSPTLKIWIDGTGTRVYMSGRLNLNGVASPSIPFNLPTAYRPASPKSFLVHMDTSSATDLVRIDIATTGDVTCTFFGGTGPGQYLPFDMVNFDLTV